MDEISRCRKILGVDAGTSLEDLKSIYRDLVQVWHPDRFAGNERLQLKAQEKLKEINAAYDFLIANAFQNEVQIAAPETDSPPVVPPPAQEKSPVEEEVAADSPEAPERKSGAIGIIAVVVLVIFAGLFFYWKSQNRPNAPTESPAAVAPGTNNDSSPPEPTNHPATVPETSAVKETEPAPPPINTSSTDLLAEMVPFNDMDAAKTADGLVLTPKGDRAMLRVTHPYRAPLTIRATVKTDLADLRLIYGLGMVIFNWADNPFELRVHDPVTSAMSAVAKKGFLATNEWHKLVWEITTNTMRVTSDGETIFEGKGNYRRIDGLVGIGGNRDSIAVKNFSIESRTPIEPKTSGNLVKPAPIPNDILSSMVSISNPTITRSTDGISLYASSLTSVAAMTLLKSTNVFHVPFIIHTVAKTDSTDLRLYAGPAGRVIFNWGGNPSELRVHDPFTGDLTAVAGRGLIYPNEWHEVTWEIWDKGMKVFIDGQLHFQN
ncbi:MAG TPA: DnaJ domain-containing protein [Verrucomicrobiae bacterium]|jgi:hypothetical protein|nr:DnaJ domain-containing protein [Verrucomicrobiae bacterium]